MFYILSSINWLSVLIAFFAYFFLGAFWYMFLFPKPYRISLGRDPEINTSQSPIFIWGPGICALITTITCAVLLNWLDVHSYAEVFMFIGIIGIGFLFTNTVNIAINPNIPRPFYYGLITGTYHLISMVIVNMILFAMKN